MIVGLSPPCQVSNSQSKSLTSTCPSWLSATVHPATTHACLCTLRSSDDAPETLAFIPSCLADFALIFNSVRRLLYQDCSPVRIPRHITHDANTKQILNILETFSSHAPAVPLPTCPTTPKLNGHAMLSHPRVVVLQAVRGTAIAYANVFVNTPYADDESA